MMVEAGADEVPEDVMLDAIFFGHDEIKKLVEFIDEIVSEVGKPKKELVINQVPEDIDTAVRDYATGRMQEAIHTFDKLERLDNMDAVEVETKEHFAEIYPDNEKDIAAVLYNITKESVRNMILDEGIRPDNRKTTEIRPVWCETGLLPRVHGSGLFTRGQTQVMSTCTLAPASEAQMIDGITEQTEKRYMHHYNFPGYSVGEARPMRSPGRREIGHGALAERALFPMIPSIEDFPYTIRLVSEILESNGSSSMGSVCGSTLSLMCAGVPIKRPVSGVAMGLVRDGDDYSILTDIQGMEDALGDMDFKVAGTSKGITAIQMDIKIAGITRDILASALAQAKEGRAFILEKMLACIDKPAAELSPYAPRVEVITIDIDKIRDVIGTGGKVVRKIIDETGVDIDIHEDGNIFITSPNMEAMDCARKMIEDIVREVEVGEVYTGRVTRFLKFGAFVELLPGKEGLCHISQLAKHRVENVEDVVKIGDQLEVKVVEIDEKGRINVSHKALL